MKKRRNKRIFFLGILATILFQVIVLKIVGVNFVTDKRYDELKSINEKYSKAEELSQELISNYYKDVDPKVIETGIYKGIFESIGDKYTVYMTKEEFEEHQEDINGNYVGIGILSDVSEGQVKVIKVFEGSSAKEAGILPGDLIVEVDGEHIDDVGYRKLIDIMLGEEGTDVVVNISREENIVTFFMKRRKIDVPFVTSSKIDDMGYIYINRFGVGASKEFKDHLNKLKKLNIKGLIIDVRDNPGGLVQESVDIADMLMDKGIIVYTLDKQGRKKEYNSDKSEIDIPFVLIGNEGSASASEILIGAIKDSDSGKIIGVQTFGKGIVQGVNSLDDGSGFKMTISEYFTPNGNNIHGTGITPDYVVEYDEIIDGDNPDIEIDIQLKKAYEIIKKDINK